MAERKSKPRKKKEEDEEPTGLRRVTQSPWFLLPMYILIIAAVVSFLFGLSSFLARGEFDWWVLVPGIVAAVLIGTLILLTKLSKR